tara:strand:+ start:446067 stop:447185 length:1119 start_codon:yes stop_codon:yes gene_type:complete
VRTAFSAVTLRWLLALALLYTLYFAQSLLIPVVVAFLFALLLSSPVALFKRFHVPRSVSAIVLLAVIGGPFALLGIELAEPAQKWLTRVPELSEQITQELDDFSRNLSQPSHAEAAATPPAEKKWYSFLDVFSEESDTAEPVAGSVSDSALSERIMQGGVEVIVSVLGATPAVLAQFMTFVILVLFLLIFGPGLYTNLVELLPWTRDKDSANAMVGKVRQELSRYILTVTVINTCLGVTTALALWLLGLEDPVLWGALVGLLNFAPYVGPVIAMGILCVAGISQYGLVLTSLLPPLVFFLINLVEAQFVTPLVLGRHMRLNPLILILWLLVWGWLWGPAGVLLAVPLLVCLKLVAGQFGVLGHWVKLVETRV